MATRQAIDPKQVPAGSILLVIHDFIARSPDELSLAKGDRIELIERDDDFGDGWFLGRHLANSSTGLFPEVYTTPAPKGNFAPPPPQRGQHPIAAQKPANSMTGAKKAAVLASSPRPASEDHSKLQPARPFNDNVTRHSADAVAPRTLTTPAVQQSAASPLAQTAMRTSLPGVAQRSTGNMGDNNQVMNETLSVIDEHITDMHTPRQSRLGVSAQSSRDGSFYNSDASRRLSYIKGHETDEEEQHQHSEAEVMLWTPSRVAEYLEDNGVEKQHCEVFRDQEISGEVLLAMEQSAVFIKEFELGSVGRRLKTWQKIKTLQEEVRANASPTVARSVSEYSAAGSDAASDIGRRRSRSTSSPFLRGATFTERPGSIASPGQDRRSATMPYPQNLGVPGATQGFGRPDSTIRPSPASIRSMNHSRRHSSIDSKVSPRDQTSETPSIASHRRKASVDRLSFVNHPDVPTPTPRRTSVSGHAYSLSGSRVGSQAPSEWGLGPVGSPNDLDRGYFSGNEVEKRNRRSVLMKRTSIGPNHNRATSTVTDPGALETLDLPDINEPNESPREPVSPIMAMKSVFGFPSSNRSVSNPKPFTKPLKSFEGAASPVVTKLEYPTSPYITSEAQSPKTANSESSSINPAPSPASHSFSFFSKPRANGGLRVISDAVTEKEKAGVSGAKGSPLVSPTRTGSTTPSTETQSVDFQKSEQSRASTGSSQGLAPPPPPPAQRPRPKVKDKKATSAYTRGLVKRSPADQMAGCDYSGWMKKKSSSLMGSWKPRLFVLRGRRLSYYYSERDTEEKGLIDISGHRVLPAEKETITGLHAQFTRAASSPTSPHNILTQTSAAADLAANPPALADNDQGLFIFKLVPPRQGLSKAVTFTKPMVHYFAVNSRQEGRLWMAALMKATIDYDANGQVTTSYNQQTISLAKARARRERPPALKEEDDAAAKAESNGVPSAAESAGGQGLEIGGLGIGGLEAVSSDTTQTTAGAEKEAQAEPVGSDSVAGSLGGGD